MPGSGSGESLRPPPAARTLRSQGSVLWGPQRSRNRNKPVVTMSGTIIRVYTIVVYGIWYMVYSMWYMVIKERLVFIDDVD